MTFNGLDLKTWLYFRKSRRRLMRAFLRQLGDPAPAHHRHGASAKADYDKYDDREIRAFESESHLALKEGRVCELPAKTVRNTYIAPIVAEIERLAAAADGPVRVLEVGCGNATNLKLLAEAFGDRVALTGIDISKVRLDVGREHWKDALEGISLHQASATDLSLFADASFDVVYSICALEQITYRLHEAVREMVRLASDCVVCVEPVYEFGNDVQRLYNIVSDQCRTLLPEFHLHGLSVEERGLMPILHNPSNPVGLLIGRKDP